jgi:hypothetical protein
MAHDEPASAGGPSIRLNVADIPTDDNGTNARADQQNLSPGTRGDRICRSSKTELGVVLSETTRG